MKRLLILGALLLPLLIAPSADAAYPTVPPAMPAYTCDATFSTLASLDTAAETAAAGTTQCLLASATIYVGPLDINRTAAGTVTVAVDGAQYGAKINGGVIVRGGSVTFKAFDVRNGNSPSGTNGDCFTVGNSGTPVTAAVSITYSKIQLCDRNGVTQTAGGSQLVVNFNKFLSVGSMDTTGIAAVFKGSSTATTQQFIENDVTGTPDDVVQGWGAGLNVSRNVWHDATAAGTNHNDLFQSYINTPNGGVATNVVLERNRTRAIAGANAHFTSLTGGATAIIRSNEIVGIGSGSNSIVVGDGTTPAGTANIQNNTFSSSGRIDFAASTGGEIRNNAFDLCTGTAPWALGTGVTLTPTNNSGTGAAGCTATGTNATNAASLGFLSASDFHLTAGSILHDTGTGTTNGSDIDNGARVVGVINRGSDED
jgi:hypothetical protein